VSGSLNGPSRPLNSTLNEPLNEPLNGHSTPKRAAVGCPFGRFWGSIGEKTPPPVRW
jgi:hypothetical protein